MKYLILIPLLGVLACSPRVEVSAPSQGGGVAVKPDRVTMANFQKVRAGQNLAEVEAVLGKGTLTSETEIEGIGKYQNYSWDAKGFASVTIVFQDGQVSSKTQFGLK